MQYTESIWTALMSTSDELEQAYQKSKKGLISVASSARKRLKFLRKHNSENCGSDGDSDDASDAGDTENNDRIGLDDYSSADVVRSRMHDGSETDDDKLYSDAQWQQKEYSDSKKLDVDLYVGGQKIDTAISPLHQKLDVDLYVGGQKIDTAISPLHQL